MEIKQAQAELRYAYFNGSVGTIISGVIWLVAAIVLSFTSISTGFTVLFFGGMFIFPLTMLAIGTFTSRKAPPIENPGSGIVIETVFPMIAGLFAAWLFLQWKPELTMPMAAIAVGAHYFGFRTAYGEPLFWILGGIMCVAGFTSIYLKIPASNLVPYAIAAIEIVFGVVLYLRCETTPPAQKKTP